MITTMEPSGGNVYRRHMRWNDGEEWRCAHGNTGWQDGDFVGCAQCSLDDPDAYLEARDRELARRERR